MASNDNDNHWLVNSIRGVNLLTLIGVALGLAAAYFDLDKAIAVLQRDMASVERTAEKNQKAIERLVDRLSRQQAFRNP